jgi:hypothetical protein
MGGLRHRVLTVVRRPCGHSAGQGWPRLCPCRNSQPLRHWPIQSWLPGSYLLERSFSRTSGGLPRHSRPRRRPMVAAHQGTRSPRLLCHNTASCSQSLIRARFFILVPVIRTHFVGWIDRFTGARHDHEGQVPQQWRHLSSPVTGLRAHTEQTKACVVSFPTARDDLYRCERCEPITGALRIGHKSRNGLVFCPGRRADRPIGLRTVDRRPRASGRAILVGPEASTTAAPNHRSW